MTLLESLRRALACNENDKTQEEQFIHGVFPDAYKGDAVIDFQAHWSRYGFQTGKHAESERRRPIDEAVEKCVSALEQRKEVAELAELKVRQHYAQPWYSDMKKDAEPLEETARHLRLSHSEKEALADLKAAIEKVNDG